MTYILEENVLKNYNIKVSVVKVIPHYVLEYVRCVTEEQLHVVRLDWTVDVSSTDKMLKCYRRGCPLRVSHSRNTHVKC